METLSEQKASSPVWRAVKNIRKKLVVVKLGVQCRRGNVAAMYKMAEMLRSCCSPEAGGLLDHYSIVQTFLHIYRKEKLFGWNSREK